MKTKNLPKVQHLPQSLCPSFLPYNQSLTLMLWLSDLCMCVGYSLYSLCCHSQLPWLDVELKLVPIYVAVLVAALLAQSKVAIIITGGVGKNGSTVAVSEFTACVHPCLNVISDRSCSISCEIFLICFWVSMLQILSVFYFVWNLRMRNAEIFIHNHHLLQSLIASVCIIVSAAV